jgi:hypothetical protein
VHLSQLPGSSFFADVFRQQMNTLKEIEEEDGKKNSLQVQVGQCLYLLFLYHISSSGTDPACRMRIGVRQEGI